MILFFILSILSILLFDFFFFPVFLTHYRP